MLAEILKGSIQEAFLDSIIIIWNAIDEMVISLVALGIFTGIIKFAIKKIIYICSIISGDHKTVAKKKSRQVVEVVDFISACNDIRENKK